MKIAYKFIAAGFLICGFHTGVIAQASADPDGSILNQMGEDEVNRLEQVQERGAATEELGDNAIDAVNKFYGAAEATKDFYDASKALDENECVPDLVSDASAMMPVSCEFDEESGNRARLELDLANAQRRLATVNAARNATKAQKDDALWQSSLARTALDNYDNLSNCRPCYEKAVNGMNIVRKNLARMSCLRMNTKRYVDSAVSFGDNVSGLHGAMGLSWQQQKKGIVAAHEKFKKSYDRKYVEMMGALDTALKGIDACEAKFGMSGWYQRAGFIYFELMKEKYKRTE